MDAVSFYMSANLGEALKPLSKVASGGELARIMLALKNVLAERDHVPTLIFDEVDTGVSGRAAQRVAEKLRALSRTKQILCETHLPQIAALADTHFRIAKAEHDGRTFTSVTPLDFEGRKARAGPHHRRREHHADHAAERGGNVGKSDLTKHRFSVRIPIEKRCDGMKYPRAPRAESRRSV